MNNALSDSEWKFVLEFFEVRAMVFGFHSALVKPCGQ
jgi:hypothetical protein